MGGAWRGGESEGLMDERIVRKRRSNSGDAGASGGLLCSLVTRYTREGKLGFERTWLGVPRASGVRN